MDSTSRIISYIKKVKVANVSQIALALKGISRQWVSTLLNKLVKSGQLARIKKGRFVEYSLRVNNSAFNKNSYSKNLINNNIQEDLVFQEATRKITSWKKITDNLKSLLNYTFTEILNNAIEHSRSSTVTVQLEVNNKNAEFIIKDNGIGIFKNIKKKFKLINELEAIQELLKGKITTLPHSHSGEGVFFTSKIADKLVIDSFNYRLVIDNEINDVFIQKIKNIKGTKVIFEIKRLTRKHLDDVFKEYQAEPNSFAFDKTKVNIKLFSAGTVFVSRSQAKRLLLNLDKFKSVVLDFKGIESIGQGFADEVFRVYKKSNPGVKIKAINTNDIIDFMIKRTQT